MDEVVFALLQSGMMINGCQQTETTLNDAKIKGIKMTVEPGLLVVEVRGKTTKIPMTNIKGFWMKPKADDKAKK